MNPLQGNFLNKDVSTNKKYNMFILSQRYNRNYSPGPVLADKTFKTRAIKIDTVHSRNTRHVIERKFRAVGSVGRKYRYAVSRASY